MGLFDHVELYDGVHLPEYPEGVPSAADVTWQTKDIDRPCMSRFRITADGRLHKAESHTETVPPKERPYASKEGVDEDDWRYYVGSMSRVHDGWIERDGYHGRFTITNSFDKLDGVVRYQVTFTHGQLKGFERLA